MEKDKLDDKKITNTGKGDQEDRVKGLVDRLTEKGPSYVTGQDSLEHNRLIIRKFTPTGISELKDVNDFESLLRILENKGYSVNEAPDFARSLAHKGAYLPAVTLFEGAFKVPDQQLSSPLHYHRSAHALYSTVIDKISMREELDALELGVPVNDIGLEFDEERGFYLPGSRFNVESGEHLIRSKEKAKEKTFSIFHSVLSETPHTTKDCPYTQMISYTL